MNPVTPILQDIRTNYSVFEKDQVLTHDQLNTVAEYFEDQTRLTRIKLLGVGILCGLRVSVKGTTVTVSKGAGVTTDGDLLFFKDDTLFDQFKVYDDSNPKYAPFAAALKKKVFQLMPKVPAKERDRLAVDLSEFKAKSGGVLDDMAAVLFMEGYVKDEDLCTGTDCDNLGQNFINTVKLLVMDKKSAEALNKTIPTSDLAAHLLTEVVADRPLLPAGLDSTAKLIAVYRASCLNIHNNLITEFAKLDAKLWASLGDRVPPDTAAKWAANLNTIKGLFGANDAGVQYYYDFLKDVAETYNSFRRLLFGDTTWCCPDQDSFPKHLLLGNLVSDGSEPPPNRTGFYPSPMVSRTVEQLSHAAFLAQKLNALIQTFALPASNAVRITPSRFEEACLEERAIPYYYPFKDANPIQQHWSYLLHQEGRDVWNYSYHAAAYKAQGGAARPLAAQIGCYPFFRIEGHLNQPVATVQASIEAEIKTSNLPFVVQAVHLGTEKGKVVKRPGIRYSDLHGFHQILRTDLSYQLEDAKTFSTHYAAQVNKLTTDDVDELPQVKNIVAQKEQAIRGGVDAARNILTQDYSKYNAVAWKPGVIDTVTAAAEFKQNLGKVTRTEYSTPFDSLIVTRHADWLNWLDLILQNKDDKETEKLLFSNFQLLHPGLEHFGGVIRGGTFVLVYDGNNKVVADFMLPYHCCEAAPEVQPHEPALPAPQPPFKQPGVIEGGITILPTFDKYLGSRLDIFTRNVIDPRINVQKDYFNFFKESMTTVANVFGSAGPGKTKAGESRFNDPVLEVSMNEADAKQRKVDLYKQKANDSNLPKEQRDKYAAQSKEAEADLVKSIQEATIYMSEANIDVSFGSEGYQAVMQVAGSIGRISDQKARGSLQSGFTTLQKQTGNAGLKLLIGLMGP
jgi:hypothetical protein